MEVIMDIWEFLKGLADVNPLEFFLALINPVYGPMILWGLLGLIVQEIQKFLGIH